MIKLMLLLLRWAPLGAIYAVSWIIGYLAYYLNNNQKHIADVNLRIAYPKMPEEAREALIRRVLVETVKNILESIKFWQLGPRALRDLVREKRGWEILESAMEEGKAVILLVPHLGNWELVNLYASQIYEITGLYRTQKAAWLDKLMYQGRGKFGAHALTADASSVRGLMKAIKQNHIIFILPDQNPGKGAGVFADFYHYSALTPVLPVRLAARTEAKVLFAYCERLPFAGGFRLNIEAADETLRQDDTEAACSAMNQGLEHIIDRIPEQYWWGYSRYRHRPEGEAPIYHKD